MDRSTAHDPRAIANLILDMREDGGKPLTIMQLIKLIYIADGWSIVLLGHPLSKEAPKAWQYGPVYPTVYRAFSGAGARPVSARAVVKGTAIPLAEDFSEEESNLIKMVVDSYGKLSAFALSNLTHQQDTPWSRAYDKGIYTDISLADIQEHYESLKETRLVNHQAGA